VSERRRKKKEKFVSIEELKDGAKVRSKMMKTVQPMNQTPKAPKNQAGELPVRKIISFKDDDGGKSATIADAPEYGSDDNQDNEADHIRSTIIQEPQINHAFGGHQHRAASAMDMA